jgi:hypothetical protein
MAFLQNGDGVSYPGTSRMTAFALFARKYSAKALEGDRYHSPLPPLGRIFAATIFRPAATLPLPPRFLRGFTPT